MGTIVSIRRRLYGWVLLFGSDDVSMDGYYCLDPTTSLWMGTIGLDPSTTLWMGTIVWIRRRLYGWGTIVSIRRRLYGWVPLFGSDDVSMDGYYCLDPTTSLWIGYHCLDPTTSP